jgi:membrane fusion protein, multidrug efflux system
MTTDPARVLRRLVSATLIVAAAAGLLGCASKSQNRSARVPVTVATAVERSMPFALVSTGAVEPIVSADVGSQVGGVVTRVAFKEGEDVQAGQLLYQLDPRPFRAALEQAKGVLAKDRAQAESARLDAERTQKLLEQNMAAQADWDQKRAAADSWLAAVQADSAALVSAALNLEYASIRAPIQGRTGRHLVNVGDLVKAGTSDPLVTINQLRPMRVRFTVPQTAVPLVLRYRDANPRVLVRSAGGDSVDLDGSLVFVDNAVDPASGTLLLKGEFPNRDGKLVPGQFVDVRLELYVQLKATVVPAAAVTTGQQGAYVYVLNPDSTVATRTVTVERTVDELAIVGNGLHAGEVVVTDGQLRLAPGSKVMVRAGSGGTS